MILAGIDTTITLSGFVAALALATAGVAGFLRLRGDTREAIETQADKRVGDALTQVDHWRDNFQAETVRADELRRQLEEQRASKHDALTRLAAAELRTDLSGLMKQLSENFTQVGRRLDLLENEQRETAKLLAASQETQLEQTRVLSAIADKIEQIHGSK